MPESLLRTKLNIPPLRPNLVQRPSLSEQLQQSLHPGHKLTLISAPAGFGKTTLASSFAAGCGLPAAWLSLDKDDNREERFLSYLVAALQEAVHTIGQEAAELLSAPQPAQPQAVLTRLINDLNKIETTLLLVLDDYQAISQQAVHEAVAFLLENCPKTCHLLIATRSDPPLPLSRWRARGQMIELRAADLRFDASETAQFLDEIMGLRLDARSITLLEDKTEGWIAGLQLAALSMRARDDVQGFIAGFSGTNRFILDYLLEEVLASQPPAIKKFLLYTSILERLSAPLCEALLAIDESSPEVDDGLRAVGWRSKQQAAAILAQLEQDNLFLLPLDDQRVWYRFHHLFADLLRAQLQQIDPAIVPRLHRRVSTWLEKQGLISEAVHHLFAVQEIDQAADLIAGYGPARLAGGDPSVLQMADLLPRETILARPKIGLYQAWLLIVQGRIGDALPLLQEMARRFAETDPQSGQAWMQTVASLALTFLLPAADRPASDLLFYEEQLEKIPAGEPILRNAADFLYAMALDRHGALDSAVEFAEKCLEQEKRSSGSPAVPTLAPFLSRGYLMQGRLRAAAALGREYLHLIKKRDLQLMIATGSMKIDLGEVLCEWNNLEEAEQFICEGLQDNEPWINVMTDSFGLAALSRVRQAKGDYAGALQAVEKLETILQGQFRPREFEEERQTLRVRLQLASGERQKAFQWADDIQRSRNFDRDIYRLTLARIRLAQGRFAEVEKLLAGKRLPPGTSSLIARQLEANLLLAAALAGQQRRQEAWQWVESALATAEAEGYLRVFLDLGQPVHDLLAAYTRSAAPGCKRYAQKILAAFPPMNRADPSALQPTSLVEPLTDRELEVLRIMAQGRTNREIAQQLVIASGTVKAHTASIYGKLNVANRTAAVALARELGILD